MRATLNIDPKDAVPIWKQIEEGLRRMVIGGGLEAGEAVPSVRELARDLRVNPATVSKAYQRLTDAGLLEVRRGQGTFVADEPRASTVRERERLLDEGASRYATTAIEVGAELGEAGRVLEVAWNRLERTEGGER